MRARGEAAAEARLGLGAAAGPAAARKARGGGTREVEHLRRGRAPTLQPALLLPPPRTGRGIPPSPCPSPGRPQPEPEREGRAAEESRSAPPEPSAASGASGEAVLSAGGSGV